MSARPCGCDPEAAKPHACEQHRAEVLRAIFYIQDRTGQRCVELLERLGFLKIPEE